MPYAECSSRKIFYQNYGQGEPIIYLHGLMGSSGLNRFFGFDGRTLAENFMVLEYDALGHGQSSGSTNPEDYQWRELAGILNSLMKELNLKQAHLAGTSMGAGTIIQFSQDFPEKIKSMILIAPPALEPGQLKAIISGFEALFKVIKEKGIARAVEFLLQLPGNDLLKEKIPNFEKGLQAWLSLQNLDYIKACALGLALESLEIEHLKKLETPALIIGWKNDPVHPEKSVKKLNKVLKNSQVHLLENMIPALTKPNLISGLIKNFLEEKR